STFADPLDTWRHRSGPEAFTRTSEALIHNPPGQSSAPNDELPHHTVDDDIACIHAEVQQRLGAVIILHKDRWLLRFGGEAQACMYSVVRGGYWLNGRATAIPVISVSLAACRRLLQHPVHAISNDIA